MKKIYFASPLFSEAELTFNKMLSEKIRNTNKFEVFLPQDNEVTGITLNEKTIKEIFDKDVNALKSCDYVVAIIEGTDVDSGTSWEIGYAYALGKPIIALRTDGRIFGGDEIVNLMIQKSVKIVKTVDELLKCLKEM